MYAHTARAPLNFCVWCHHIHLEEQPSVRCWTVFYSFILSALTLPHIPTLEKRKNNASSRQTRTETHETQIEQQITNNAKRTIKLKTQKRETPTRNEKKCQEQRQLILHSNQLDCSSHHFETSKILLSLVAGAAWPPLSLGAASLHPRAFGQCCFSIFFVVSFFGLVQLSHIIG